MGFETGASGFDPTDQAQVADALSAELGVIWPGSELLAPPQLVPAATSTWVWFVELGGGLPDTLRGPRVLRLFEPGQSSRSELEGRLCDELATLHYPAPATAWSGTLGGLPAQLQQRLPGVPVMDVIAGPRIREIVWSLGALQARLHGLPTENFPVPDLGAQDYLDADVARRLSSISTVDTSGTWAWLQRTAPSVETGQRVLCHGDFHPLNAIIAPDRSIGIVDWTDACIADRHHDVGRTVALFRLAYLLAQSRAERWALRALRGRFVAWHVRAYERVADVVVDERRLAWWQVVHLFRSWVQLAELREGTVVDRSSTTIEALPDDLPDRLLDVSNALRRSVKG